MEEQLLRPKRNKFPAGTTTPVILSICVVMCGSLAYGFAVGYSSPAQSGIMVDLGLSIADYSTFGAILTLGGTIGALVSGTIADMIGRRVISNGNRSWTSPLTKSAWLSYSVPIHSLRYRVVKLPKSYSAFSSIMTFGGMIGALISGKVADLFGRRVTMWLLDLSFILGWCSITFGKWFNLHVCACQKRAWWLDAGRLLMEVGAGISYMCIDVFQFTLVIGFSLAYYIGNNMSWRTLALVGATPCFIQVLGVFFIPESPRWLDYTETVQQHSGSKFMDLFSWKYARPLIVGTGLMALVQFGGSSGMTSFASSIFRADGCSADSASKIMAILQVPFAAMSIILTEKAGRRLLMMVTSAGACLGCFLVALGFLFEMILLYHEQDYHQSAELTSSMILPVNIKGSAGSLTTLVNCFTSWIVSYTFNFLFQWNAAGIFFLFAFFCGAVVIFVAMLVPESTRDEGTDT
ncbi:hypothetical protein RND71_000876 [Anisodus tanguticus]|uniref:Major facilitator superfamily (MFS) profile domain-containing protein n=1 Tax=Anisodus tanguticus TaxID=243964 RepID=A0AAE1VXT4_9SOLA|nr:hypothetical protein RND71_000876 [Anisodus tanguticus]